MTSLARYFLALPRLLFIVLLSLLFAFWVNPSKHALAITCKPVHESLADRFTRAPLVFTGIAEPPTGRDAFPFTVSHLYKAPWADLPEQLTVLLTNPQSGDRVISGFTLYPEYGKEYLIFAYDAVFDGAAISAQTGPCGNYGLTVDATIQDLRNKQQKAPSSLAEEASLIFTGRVIQTYQWATESHEGVVKPVSAFVQFDPLEIFTSGPLPLPKHDGPISLYIGTCGDAYEVGQTYLVQASRNTHAKPRVSSPFGPTHYASSCMGKRAMNVNEKEILRELSLTLQKQK